MMRMLRYETGGGGMGGELERGGVRRGWNEGGMIRWDQ